MATGTINYRKSLDTLDDLDRESFITWVCRPGLANNSIRQRLSTARTFIAWLQEEHGLTENPLPLSVCRDITRRFPKVYGKKQAKNPGRRLTYDEAYGQLIGACKDGTWHGSRDQLFIRFGLLGLRLSEILNLNWANYRNGQITITGKKNHVREVHPGPEFRELLTRWKRKYEKALGRAVTDTDPILCPSQRGNPETIRPGYVWDRPLQWGKRLHRTTADNYLHRRAEKAGLGWVSPHDLRRTAAHILHVDKTPDGAHRYDLYDIQQVLDHADPATTQRSYLDQSDRDEVKNRAGHTLD